MSDEEKEMPQPAESDQLVLPKTEPSAPIEKFDIFGDGRAFVFYNVLSPAECAELIRQGEAFGFTDSGYVGKIRQTDRLQAWSASLSDLMFERTKHLMEDELDCTNRVPGISAEGVWQLVGVNPTFRMCRYYTGGFFVPHFDYGYEPSPTFRSLKTFMVVFFAHSQLGTR
eukprot:c18248_g1_i1.p1 GENE.c18248_g1_i1~~c18248_g1_i1.p1  ORF type:complete len:170 (+),score=26.86 c18248_g1_i1:46-555(+)